MISDTFAHFIYGTRWNLDQLGGMRKGTYFFKDDSMGVIVFATCLVMLWTAPVQVTSIMVHGFGVY